MSSTFTFKINGPYRPETIPLERLGNYLEALGDLLGEAANVHFGGLEDGSVVVIAKVDEVAAPKVRKRVSRISDGNASNKTQAVLGKIEDLLWEDNATGQLKGGNGQVLYIDFQGRNRPEPVTYGPVKQLGTIDGEVFRVEGRDKTVHVSVMDGPRTYSLEAPASMGHELAGLFRIGPVRFRGEGNWLRNGEGAWELRKFKIEGFEALDDQSVVSVLNSLRESGSGEWSSQSDPIGALKAEREDGH